MNKETLISDIYDHARVTGLLASIQVVTHAFVPGFAEKLAHSHDAFQLLASEFWPMAKIMNPAFPKEQFIAALSEVKTLGDYLLSVTNFNDRPGAKYLHENLCVFITICEQKLAVEDAKMEASAH